VDLASKKRITQMLLKSGATINEINTVRKHISDFKGGQVAKKAYPSTVLSLLLSDVVGDPLDVIASGPTVPDTTTFYDAVHILRKFGLWDRAPASTQRILSKGIKGHIPETPKENDPCFRKVHNIVIGNNRTACMAAVSHLRNKNLNTLFISSSVEGEARDLGTFLGAIGRETAISGNPMVAPFGAIIGGETTVTVKGLGKGGRNQEIALSAAHKIAGFEKIVIASFNTDGIDGPTDAAGAIVDGNTLSRAKRLNMETRDYMKNNDSYTFFSKLGDNIITGPTGTNVNDISILVTLL
jgi:glycerate-2-kinase